MKKFLSGRNNFINTIMKINLFNKFLIHCHILVANLLQDKTYIHHFVQEDENLCHNNDYENNHYWGKGLETQICSTKSN